MLEKTLGEVMEKKDLETNGGRVKDLISDDIKEIDKKTKYMEEVERDKIVWLYERSKRG